MEAFKLIRDCNTRPAKLLYSRIRHHDTEQDVIHKYISAIHILLDWFCPSSSSHRGLHVSGLIMYCYVHAVISRRGDLCKVRTEKCGQYTTTCTSGRLFIGQNFGCLQYTAQIRFWGFLIINNLYNQDELRIVL